MDDNTPEEEGEYDTSWRENKVERSLPDNRRCETLS